jgi:hypothetical protein
VRPSRLGSKGAGGGAALAPAVVYREVRVNRGVYALVLAALLAPWALVGWISLSSPRPALALSFMVRGYAGASAFQLYQVAVAALLGVAVVAHDRWQGSLVDILEGPVRRRDVWLAKAALGTLAVATAAAAVAAAMVAAAVATGLGGMVGGVLLTALGAMGAQLAMFALALALSGAMAPAYAVAATLVCAALPSLLGSLVAMLFVPLSYAYGPLPAAGPPPPVRWALDLSSFLPSLSPLAQGYGSGLPLAAHAAWFLACALGLVALGLRWWEAAPYERLRDAFFHPALWGLYRLFLALATGFAAYVLIVRGTARGVAFAVIYGLLSLLAWLGWGTWWRRRGAAGGRGA